MGTWYGLRVRLIGLDAFDDYVRRTPRSRRYVSALRALLAAADWRRLTDAVTQFAQVAEIVPPDRVVLDFAEEDLRVELRVNCAIGLARVVSAGSSARTRRRIR